MLNVHDPPAAIVAPEKFNELEPATAVTVPVPHVLLKPLGVDIARRRRGKLPDVTKPTPLNEFEGLGFVIVKVNEVVPPIGIEGAPTAMFNVGGAITVRVA